jgi:hypothetical protein
VHLVDAERRFELILVASTIRSAVIVDIIDAFNNGKVGGAFSCEDNSNSVAN